jgi:hypothetical protein
LAVDIPCPGHAPLIIGELKETDGVITARYRGPDLFDVTFDAGRVSVDEILAQSVFQSFAARVSPQ